MEELRECVGVWRGTGEERARGKWVAEVEGWVEGEVGRGKRRGGGAGAGAGAGAGTDTGGGGERESAQRDEERAGGEELPGRTGSGAGFLRRLRDEIYLE